MLEILRGIVQEASSAEDFQAALNIIVLRIRQAMRTEVASVYLIDHSINRYLLMATEGLNSTAVGKASLALSEGLVGQVGQREKPINIQNASTHPKYRYLKETGEERFHAFLGVPIIHQKRVLGVLVVQQTISRAFDQSEEAFLVTISAQLAAVIAHAQASGHIHPINHTANTKPVRLSGISGTVGIGVGQAVLCQTIIDLSSIPLRSIQQNLEQQIQRFKEAIWQVQRDINQLKNQVNDRLNAEEALLFDVYHRLLEDNALGGEVLNKIKQGFEAEGALAYIVHQHLRNFGLMDDPYLRERGVDIKDLGARILNKLLAKKPEKKRYPEQCILVGEEITTSHLIEIPKNRLSAVVSRQGSKNSHMAIVARSLGIPTVVGALDLPLPEIEGCELIVDGYQGEVIWGYSHKLKQHYLDLIRQEKNLMSDLESFRNKAAKTADGYPITLYVNTGLMADVSLSLDRGAEGVGLYRTEIPFMLQDRFPSETEQFNIYRKQLLAFAPKPVTMRTLDIGGDKALPYFPIEEENPFLGWRGIRVTLDHPEIFILQIRAMIKASAELNNLRILLPMISNVFEAEHALHLIHRAYEEVSEEGYTVQMPPVGVMIEIPAAVYQTTELAQRVDFLSVGTNDLTQYLLAVDRNNPRVADLYQSYHPAVLKALYDIIQQANQVGTPVSVCGEMAGDPLSVILLLAMGYQTLSMSASCLAKVKWAISQISMSKTKEILNNVLQLDNAEMVRSYLKMTLSHEGLGELLKFSNRALNT